MTKDVDNRRATSDVFSPELILDAFPIVSDDRFDALPGASDCFDDGCSFEQIITAYSDVPLGQPEDVEENDYRIAATLGISLREYEEGASYERVTCVRIPCL